MVRKYGIGGGVLVLALFLAGCAGLFNKPPVADFSWKPVEPFAGEEVTFDASRSYDPDKNDTLDYSWLINGERLTGMIVRYTFPDNGVYDVTLTVTDHCNVSTSVTKRIIVKNPSPQIRGITVYDCNGGRIEAGDRLRFCVSAVDPAGISPQYISEVKWDFGDGSAHAFGKCVEHCYSRGCRYYTVTVSVKDDDGATKALEKTIYVYCKDYPPSAIFQVWPGEITQGTTVYLSGENSHDNDRCCVPCPDCPWDCGLTTPECNGCRPYCNGRDRIVSYRWTITPSEGSSFTLWGREVSFVASQTGSYRIRLQVRDDENNYASATRIVEVTQ
ncbi:PKD domain-containing protein [bacterium]|nr:PKD domain-containing protein [bacterium]